jgi:hypothetical protein
MFIVFVSPFTGSTPGVSHIGKLESTLLHTLTKSALDKTGICDILGTVYSTLDTVYSILEL